MDPAVAAAMSDPERNPHFRRRWHDVEARRSANMVLPPQQIGTFGLALQQSLLRRPGVLRRLLPEDRPHG